MVDPSEAEEQNSKSIAPQLGTSSVVPGEQRLPDQADGAITEEESNVCDFQTPPTNGSQPSPCHISSQGAESPPPPPESPPPPPESPPPPPESPPPPPPEPEGDPSPKLHLDLYNFDCPAAEGSRYVLTSPRSLEACARCGVKPVELLSRPLSDFAREAPGRSMRVATGLFEVYERDRHAKLRHCREERERIVREEKRRAMQAAVNSCTSPLEQHQVPTKPPTQETPSSVSASKPARSLQSKATKVGSTGPKQSSGKILRPESSGPQKVLRKSSRSKPSSTYPRPTPKAPVFVRAKSTLTPSVSKVNGAAGGGSFSHHNGHSHPKALSSKSHSLESLQRKTEAVCSSASNTTTCTSSESGTSSHSWDGRRDHWAKASSPRTRTLAAFNSLMGRSLSLGDLSHSPQTTQKVERIVKEVRRRGLNAVSERDRKIAALMLARYQEEDIMSQTRYVAQLQWDTQRRMEELRRERDERDKQRAVQEGQRLWQTQVSTRQRRLGREERRLAAAKMRQAEESEKQWRELAERQERKRLRKLQQAAREEKHKKSLQEQNLKALEEERAAVLEQERLLLREKLTMAELKRQEKEHQSQEERRGLNKAERRRHAALIQEIARREQEECEEVKRAAQEKLNRSLENYEHIVERRGQELREKAKREDDQIQRARRAAENLERRQRRLLEARAREADERARQAVLSAEERAKEKARRAVQNRREKERLQRLNRQRVEEEERQRRRELLQSIERKLEKSEQIFKEKRAVLESARSVARASFHVRDKVREETNGRTFDKMALEAQLKAGLDDK
ncbi:coiled-coil domain-containing protein 177 [Hippocampus zosterae]|uniref:coiled-coil domain-containing protein 177 n=1 Tax=Hippocampus zosterae TaxID=109293 RepID=UPI00223CC845|nr:coiled-coil domain-containing protein 177 [Hippocampus zosterae]XP_051943011.1 coiled-coil domain-containing protein 177 [Hippocampus zosterae]